MAFTFASTMDEVLHLALLPHPSPVKADAPPGASDGSRTFADREQPAERR
jgi:hypothetical protein